MVSRNVVVVLLCVVWSVAWSTEGAFSSWSRYHSNDELRDVITHIAKTNPMIAKMTQIGASAQGRAILSLCMGNGIGAARHWEVPAVKLVGNLHGDEVVGRELLLRFAYDLVHNYGDYTTNDGRRATAIMDNVDVCVVPSANPDGYVAHRRRNSRGIDLNRDFPDQYQLGSNGVSGVFTENSLMYGRQPETQALMNMSATIAGTHFVLSAGFHGGAVVVNYPWDGTANHKTKYATAPDDTLFKMIASGYANAHRTMNASTEFTGGITNGAAWYPLYGGMQDWEYIWNDCMGITVELTEEKWPSATLLQREWAFNRNALYSFVELPMWCGMRGTIHSREGSVIGHARVSVSQINKQVSTDKHTGGYYRLLAPGEYDVWAHAVGYKSSTRRHIVVPVGQKKPLVIDFVLDAV